MESKWTVRQRLAVATARDGGGRADRTTTGAATTGTVKY